jgi:DNA-binding NtrC family response regulator
MMRPIILLTDPNTEWAKMMRATIHKLTKFTMTGSETRLKRFVRLHPSRIIVIIDTRQVSNVAKLIEEIKIIHKNVIVLAATSSLSWEDTVSYIKAGASEILIKTVSPKQITAVINGLNATHDNTNEINYAKTTYPNR